MKKLSILFVSGALLFALSNCGPSKKATAEEMPPPPAKTTYSGNLSTVVMDNCAPCHIPAKGGRKKPYDNFVNVKADIDDIIRRIELSPNERGFMPFKKTERLSDSVINVFKQWKADGMLEN